MVPRDDTCDILNPQPPLHEKSCEAVCRQGEYLDEETAVCRPCPIGSYSLGNGVRFDRWTDIPLGFSVTSSSFSFPEFGYEPKSGNCSSSGWKPQNDFISSGIDDCSSSLTYSVDITSKGSVSFVYQSTDEDLILHFIVRNSECRILSSNGGNKFLSTTGTKWKKYSMPLESGRNVLTWKSTGLLLGNKNQLRPAMIKSVEIMGVSFTTTCHPCKAGYFTDVKGSDWCKPCPANTYSEERSGKCNPCDTSQYYSFPASSSCMKKPACTTNDYFKTLSPCKNGITTVSYGWKKPKVCMEELEGSFQLPKSGTEKKCPPCNKGYVSGAAGCTPCPEGTYSKPGNNVCLNCSIGSRPTFGFHYHWWDGLPTNMAVSCLTVHSETCLGEQGWVPNGGMISTSQSEIPIAYLLMRMEILGFRSFASQGNGENEYGKLQFVFKLNCIDDCVLYLMKNVRGAGTTVLASWHGQLEHSNYEHIFHSNESMNLTWAFQKTSHNSYEIQKYVNDKAVIYSIEVVNAIRSPAIDCTECLIGSDDTECIPCSPGHHIDEGTSSCKKCPYNAILPHQTYHAENCTFCLRGTESNNAQTACESDCTYYSKVFNRTYEFPILKNGLLALTPPSFSGGHKYVHHYNFSLCDNNGVGIAVCSGYQPGGKSLEKISAMICRSTTFTSLGSDDKGIHLYSQPKMIASVLKQVYEDLDPSAQSECPSPIFPNVSKLHHPDVIYEFSHSTTTDECPKGLKAFVRLRCNPTILLADSSIKMPSQYPEGSCDGCNFHFLWESEGACPLCDNRDYISVQGSCEDGYISVRSIWHQYPKPCIGGSLPDDIRTGCTDPRTIIQLVVLTVVVILVLMVGLSCALWKKSRKLEYKYQKLMANPGSSNQQPAAETCGVSSSEPEDSDDETVLFKKKKSVLTKNQGEHTPLNHSQIFIKM